jgi:plasmid maintenance system antidote protein VapI
LVLIHEKIAALLEQRRLKKRDLARALGVSPQTATDICKGRSAITLPHLRNLITFFEVRAEFWLDDERLVPAELDRLAQRGAAVALDRTGLPQLEDPERLMQRLRTFVQRHRTEFLAAFPDLSLAERRLLGLADAASGSVGLVAGGLASSAGGGLAGHAAE